MLTIRHKSKMPGDRWFIILQEVTGLAGITDIDPATGITGMRTGAFFVTAEWLEKTSLDSLIINTVLSHFGNEEDRIPDKDGPYIDEFGFYVYSTGELGTKLSGRKNRDERYDSRQELPGSVAGYWDEDRSGEFHATAINELYRV